MPTAQEIYASAVRNLSPDERLRLAALILEELAQSQLTLTDTKDYWSNEDMEDLSKFALQYATAAFPEEEEIA
jgi:hypothetical protein